MSYLNYKTGAIYKQNTSQSLTASDYTTLNFETPVYDPLSLVTVGANWIFTVPSTGVYLIHSVIYISSFLQVVGTEYITFLNINTTRKAGLQSIIQSAYTDSPHLAISFSFPLVKNDTIASTVYHNNAGAINTANLADYLSQISIFKL